MSHHVARAGKMMGVALAIGLAVTLTACSHTEPGIEVRTQTVYVEVPAPCPAEPPVRPDPFGPLPEHAQPALAAALAKLMEYSGDGQFADKAELYWQTCPPTE